MASEFKHLEFLPLDEENLVINEDPESNLRSKSCLNLGFVGLNTLSRFKNISKINARTQQGTSSFLDLSYSLESVLMSVLSIETITNPQHTDITEHYRRRQLSISSNKILPSFGYCQNLTFTGFKPWAGLYGTLGYYINLLEDYEEYYTPSELIYYSSKSLLSYSKGVAYNSYVGQANIDFLLLSEFYQQAIEEIEREEFLADKKIYDLSKNIILASPLVKEVHAELRFYTDWLQRVLEWFNDLQRQNKDITIKEVVNSNEEIAKNLLLKVVYSLFENGFNESFKENIAAKFIKQTIPTNLYTLLSSLGQIRKTSTYVIEERATSNTENLVKEFHASITQFRNTYDYNKASNIILESFAPPGGYALFQVLIAAQLLNRAYILSYRNIKRSDNIFLSDEYLRITKLIGYAGILLIKTSVPHIQLLGVNILKTYRIYLTDIDPNNLLDL